MICTDCDYYVDTDCRAKLRLEETGTCVHFEPAEEKVEMDFDQC